MAGTEVTRSSFDMKAAEAVIAVRAALRKVENVNEFLKNNPSNAAGGDLLKLPTSPTDGSTPGFGYSDDEAYLIRFVFEGLAGLPAEQFLTPGRKLTGLD